MHLLENALVASPTTISVAEPILFNLGTCFSPSCFSNSRSLREITSVWFGNSTMRRYGDIATLYELRSAGSLDKKRALLVEVAKWSGDGLKTSCLKLQPV